VPLRTLTTTLIAAAEQTCRRRVSSAAWPARPSSSCSAARRALVRRHRASLATRAYKASVSIATIADDPDVALDLLSHAVARSPTRPWTLADEFLKLWEKAPQPPPDGAATRSR
jgi:hypothetical protein